MTTTPWALSVPEAGRRFYSMGRDASYAAAERGEIPCVRVGRRLVVPVHAVLRQQGASDALIALVLRDAHSPERSEAGPCEDPATASNVVPSEGLAPDDARHPSPGASDDHRSCNGA